MAKKKLPSCSIVVAAAMNSATSAARFGRHARALSVHPHLTVTMRATTTRSQALILARTSSSTHPNPLPQLPTEAPTELNRPPELHLLDSRRVLLLLLLMRHRSRDDLSLGYPIGILPKGPSMECETSADTRDLHTRLLLITAPMPPPAPRAQPDLVGCPTTARAAAMPWTVIRSAPGVKSPTPLAGSPTVRSLGRSLVLSSCTRFTMTMSSTRTTAPLGPASSLALSASPRGARTPRTVLATNKPSADGRWS